MPVDSYGNEIWEQQEMFTCSWGVNSGFKHLQDELDCLVPFQGMCENPRTKNKNLEKYRQASNAAYDLFNNGLCNYQRLFKDIYGWSVGYRETSYANRMTWSHWEDRVEEVLTPIILEAAKEQGIQ